MGPVRASVGHSGSSDRRESGIVNCPTLGRVLVNCSAVLVSFNSSWRNAKASLICRCQLLQSSGGTAAHILFIL